MKAILTNINPDISLTLFASKIEADLIYIKEDEYQNTIQQLLLKQPRKYKPIRCNDRLVIMFNFDEVNMDLLLKQFRDIFDYKAIVTSTNVKWTVQHLLKEIKKEDQFMKGRK